MIAMWTSRHDDLASDDVVAPYVFDPMVVPACGVVLTRCNSLGSAVDAGLDAAARVLGAERAAGGGAVYVPQAFHVSPSTLPINAQRVARVDYYSTCNLLLLKK
jgi:hypothetical protein